MPLLTGRMPKGALGVKLHGNGGREGKGIKRGTCDPLRSVVVRGEIKSVRTGTTDVVGLLNAQRPHSHGNLLDPFPGGRNA